MKGQLWWRAVLFLVLVGVMAFQGYRTWQLCYGKGAPSSETELERADEGTVELDRMLDLQVWHLDRGESASLVSQVYTMSRSHTEELLERLSSMALDDFRELVARAACERLQELGGLEVLQPALARFPQAFQDSVTGLISLELTDAQIMEMLQQSPSDHDPRLEAYIKALGRRDPARALDLVDSFEGRQSRNRYFEVLMESYAAIDPEGAYRRALRLEAGFPRKMALAMASEAWAEQDPHAALAGIASMGVTEGIGRAIGLWARDDLEGAMRHFVEMYPHLVSEGSCISATTNWTAGHDAQALVEAAALLPEATQGQWLSMAIASDRFPVDTALTLIEAIPPGRHHENASEAIAKRLARENWQGALDWVERLPYPESHDAALKYLSNHTYHGFDTVIQVLQRMHHTEEAREVARYRFEHWKRQDPAGAEAWLAKESGGLSREMRSALAN